MVSTIDINNVSQMEVDNIKVCLDHVRNTLKNFSDLNIQQKNYSDLNNEESKVKPFELSKLMNSLEILHRPYMDNEKIRFNIIYSPEDVKKIIVTQDFHSLLFMFNNLMINSVTALEETTNPEIRIVISQINENKSLKFIFSDNGYGIKKENREKIFTPYFTTKPDGTGVGLTHVKYVLDSVVLGTINLVDETNENTFTTFDIIIPIENKNETQDTDY